MPVGLLYPVFSVRFSIFPTYQVFPSALSDPRHAPIDGFRFLLTFFSLLSFSFFSSILHRWPKYLKDSEIPTAKTGWLPGSSSVARLPQQTQVLQAVPRRYFPWLTR